MERTIFWGSLTVLLLMAAPLFIAPDLSFESLVFVNSTLEDNFSFIYTWLAIAVLTVSLWVIFSPAGKIKFGTSAPNFSLFSWSSMLFCAGVATGILYWGTIEWAYYMNTPPFGIEPGTTEAIEWSATYGMFHWNIAGWAFYVIPALICGSRRRNEYYTFLML